MRQTKTNMTEGKGAKRCSACGAKLWMWDSMMLKWSGPWHFQECPSIPGGNELDLRNLEERERWQEEKAVPRKQAARILKAINLMMVSPNDEVMRQRKVAIQEEIREMCKRKISVRE